MRVSCLSFAIYPYHPLTQLHTAMNGQMSDWIKDVYDRLWSRSEEFTTERHGLTILTCLPPSHLGQIIAVRDEYPELWDFIKEAHEGKHYEGLVLTGHTGGTGARAMLAQFRINSNIRCLAGKHYFILYAFARAMKERIPVAFCDSPSEYYFCDGTGCRLYPTSPLVLHKVHTGKFFLALVGSGESMPVPPRNFLHRSQMCFTIQATSPLSALRCHWSESIRDGAQYWIMSPWTENEVHKLQ